MENQFLKRIENFISDYSLISTGDKIVLGVSGGADSVALLEVLNELKGKYDLRLFVVHINHGLREEAAKEEKYVESLCKERNIPFY
ncbi:MAG: tRNA(Ile)-lysidine synthetase, partial [Lachnospiraceae bacterium]|nr:tRNA(Ile)-lysidine synthetase [Lachnospiraceae bacterium]